MRDYTIVDIETTGLSRARDCITEIAAMRVKDDSVMEFSQLVNPEVPIPGHIKRLTGIDDEMVRDKPKIHEVIPEFLDFLGESIFIAHNASFDYGFLKHNIELSNRCFENHKLCTRKLANRLVPELGSKKLSCLCEHFDIRNEQAHRAMSDVKATHELFLKLLERMKEKGIDGKEKILRFERKPKKKIQ
ncbi:MAG: 3'-5' exonuclease [Nanobdellota archaeon]